MLEILAIVSGIITIFGARTLWKNWQLKHTPPKYSILFTIKETTVTFLEKTYTTKEEYEYDEEQLIEIAKDPNKNIFLRLAGITDITIRNLTENYNTISLRLLTQMF
jgi:hypothetical protein